jgi:molecular chaperone HscB
VDAVDAFAAFGLPRAFALPLTDLDKRFRELSRACHPDLRPAAELDAALAESAALNAAYATLKDPQRRAEHLLALAGAPEAAASRADDPDFLANAMEWREAFDEALEPTARAAVRHAVENARAEAWTRLAEALAAADFPAARQALNRSKYCAGLLREFSGR